MATMSGKLVRSVLQDFTAVSVTSADPTSNIISLVHMSHLPTLSKAHQNPLIRASQQMACVLIIPLTVEDEDEGGVAEEVEVECGVVGGASRLRSCSVILVQAVATDSSLSTVLLLHHDLQAFPLSIAVVASSSTHYICICILS